MSIYCDWRFEDFFTFTDVASVPKSNISIPVCRMKSMPIYKRICRCLEFYKHSYSILLLLSSDFYNLAPRRIKNLILLLLLLLLLIFVCSHMGFSTLNYKIIRNMYI
jgi:hypothetical protein